ncbi:hypothetical protein [uncultured Zhongshania sp.]|uniref:hypothetical protein n=1 Tax=uncultured Zhongshania sp. TaxID=1642288 RepID=UPI0025DFE45E|nr:hypothetical protein [uncultured Zhongshania sp.]
METKKTAVARLFRVVRITTGIVGCGLSACVFIVEFFRMYDTPSWLFFAGIGSFLVVAFLEDCIFKPNAGADSSGGYCPPDSFGEDHNAKAVMLETTGVYYDPHSGI